MAIRSVGKVMFDSRQRLISRNNQRVCERSVRATLLSVVLGTNVRAEPLALTQAGWECLLRTDWAQSVMLLYNSNQGF